MKDLGLLGSIKESYSLVFKNYNTFLKMLARFFTLTVKRLVITLEIFILLSIIIISLFGKLLSGVFIMSWFIEKLTFGAINPINEASTFIIALVSIIAILILVFWALWQITLVFPAIASVSEKILYGKPFEEKEIFDEIKSKKYKYLTLLLIFVVAFALLHFFMPKISIITTILNPVFYLPAFQIILLLPFLLLANVIFALIKEPKIKDYFIKGFQTLTKCFLPILIISLIFQIFSFLIYLILLNALYSFIYTIIVFLIFVPIIQTNLTYWYLKSEEKEA